MKAKEFLNKITMTGYSKSTRQKIFAAGREDEDITDQVAKLLDSTTSEEELLKALEQFNQEMDEE